MQQAGAAKEKGGGGAGFLFPQKLDVCYSVYSILNWGAIHIIDVPKEKASTFMKILLNFNQRANLKFPLYWWEVGTWSQLSGSLKGSEGDQEPSLAACPNPKCLKETTKINFNHVPGSSFFEEEKWGGEEEGRRGLWTIKPARRGFSQHFAFSCVLKPGRLWKPQNIFHLLIHLEEKKKKPVEKGREAFNEPSF